METTFRRREQEVWHALDELWSIHGDQVYLTGEAIREHLVLHGKSKGSPNEIYKYRKTWAKTRRLGLGNLEPEQVLADPISRAVQLVHEKLKEESLQEINQIKNKFEEEILAKEKDIEKLRESQAKVVKEYGDLEQREKSTIFQKNQLQEQLSAEIDVRKVSEHELNLYKTKLLDEKKAQEILLKELKEGHEKEIARGAQEFNRSIFRCEEQIKTLEQEKKQMGYEFSEQLNQLKVEIYNKDSINKDLQKKMDELALRVKEQTLVHEQSKEEKIALLIRVQCLETESKEINNQLLAKISDEKNLKLALKKAELMVARLRAYKG